jgi:hypothetical protein
MRRFHATILLIALFLQTPTVSANTESNDRSPNPVSEPAAAQPSDQEKPVDGTDGSASAVVEPASPVAEGVPLPPLSRDEICRMIERAANEEALPPEFFARLIWQESRFDPRAVSPVGAQGIAQFMPRTANGRGLANPFDALPALFESAEYLAELRRQFGNLGLAAAAYNAGPKRVQDWLAKRGPMSTETRNYVRFITGHALETWTAAEPPSLQDIAVESFRCHEVPRLAAQRYRIVMADALAASIARRAKEAKEARAEAAAKAERRGAARSKLLAKRNGKPSSPNEQVAKVIVSGKHIRIASAGKPAAQSRKQSRSAKDADRVAKRQNERPNLTIMADNAGRRGAAKKAERSDRGQKVARVKSSEIGASRRTRVSENTRAGAEKRCSQAKGSGRKGCREA